METNSVVFCKLFEANELTGEGGEFGVLVANYVDEDELYPYSPKTRLRIDVTAAITLSLQPRKKTGQLSGGDDEGEGEDRLEVLRKAMLAPQREPQTADPRVAAAELHSALQMLLRAPVSQQEHGAGAPSFADITTDDGGVASSGSGSDQDAQKKKKKKKKKSEYDAQAPPVMKRARPSTKRIPTYYVRKAEKTTLEMQVQLLQAQLGYLKSENQTLSSRLLPFTNARSLLRKQLENNAMLDAVQNQQLSFARAQSAFGKRVSTQHQLPFASHIRLSKDSSERDATLLALRDKKFEVAKQYLAERARYLDPGVSFAENSRFTTPDGDLSAIHFNVVPFDGITSVKQVFDALLFYFFNMEISVSEMLGDITIREDDGIGLQGISQNRLISSVHDKVQVETNSVMFCNLFDASKAGGEGDIGVIVADSVNEDELYPYSPETRLRNDVTAAITVSLQPRKKINRLAGQEEEEELVVVLTRTCLLSLRRTELPVPAHEIEGIRENFERWNDAMMRVVREMLYSSPPAIFSGGIAPTSVVPGPVET